MTPDDIRSETVDALRLLGSSTDDFVREEYLQGLLTFVHQAGRIDANNEQIARNSAALAMETLKCRTS